MIRLVFLLRRKPGMSRAEFQKYWRETHAPLVAGHATRLNILRYVQNHTLDDAFNQGMNEARGGRMEAPYDGVAELWWESEQALEAAMVTPAGQAAGAELLADEAKFIDLPNSPLHMAYEYPQINPTPENVVAAPKSDVVKVYFPLRHPTQQNEADVRRYWLTNHGPIIRSHGQAMGILRYMQVHRAGHAADEALRSSRGVTVEPYLGHAEAWVSRNRVPTPEAEVANLAAVEDESKFIDFERSAMWICKEHSIIDRR